jgi:hypothetical protein
MCYLYIFCCFSADVLYDLGTALDVISPLCPQLFLEVAGLGNFAKVQFLFASTEDNSHLEFSFT